VQTTVTVTGLKFGDAVNVSFNQSIGATSMSAAVSSADTAVVTWVNVSGAPVDIVSGTLRCVGVRGS